MGYLIKSGGGTSPHSTVSVTDAVWSEVISHASGAGYSAPHLLMLEVRREPVHIDDNEAKSLHSALSHALQTSLVGTPLEDQEGDRLDRDTVHRINHVLLSGDVSLVRTRRWKAGD
jgi:hypothetical protein